jgi:hypothetical protein
MGVNTHVVAYKLADEKWQAMKAVYDSCLDAGVSIPDQVLKFFNYNRPDSNGVEIIEAELVRCGAIVPDDDRRGFNIDLPR